MARGLYRVYLYTVTILLAVFGAFSTSNLLSALLRLTPLRGDDSQPTSAEVTQAALLFAITLVVAGGFGALHYWLIRRDGVTDPTLGESGPRAFLLNLAEGAALASAITMGISAFGQIGSFYSTISGQVAGALASGGLALALDLERRRATPTRGAALVFERLRRHGLPLYLLGFTLFWLYNATHTTEQLIAQNSGVYACYQPNDSGFYPYIPCVGNEIYGVWLAAAFATGAWLFVIWTGRRDARSLLRQVALLIGWLGGGMVMLVIALERGAEYLLRLLTPGATPPDYVNNFQAISFFVPAAVTLAVYGWALRDRGGDAPLNANTVRLTMRALAGAALAVPLWLGVAFTLYRVFQMFTAQQPSPNDWDAALAYVVAGVGYIPLAFWLGAGSAAWDIKGPRRGFVLALLGAGALTTAGGAATLLFAVLSPALNVPLDDWQDLARSAGAALVTGLALGGLYLFIALRERQFIPAPPAPSQEPEATPAAALDEALAQFKAGELTQDQAAERIRELARSGALV